MELVDFDLAIPSQKYNLDCLNNTWKTLLLGHLHVILGLTCTIVDFRLA